MIESCSCDVLASVDKERCSNASMPGCLVQHVHDLESQGLIIACDANAAMVLWSSVPRFDQLLVGRLADEIAQDIDKEILQSFVVKARKHR